MTAAETIAAAIEKLEGLRSASSPGPWRIATSPYDVDLVSCEGSALLSGGEGYGWFREDADLDAVVTLHRTLDPVLAILRDSLRNIEVVGEGPRAPLGIPEAFNLARAILGES
ncbi:hypothetical protein ACFVU2_21260 [Leifsonia sp. NPDC058194]|uniref:hypothetical protein n=1 Tax=Leifsonia sp. NPDC058194 TaxID=3346374 RepID=UPI0036DA301A